MAKDDMKILITGYLDETKTTNIINKQLKKIEKNLKLNIGIDNKQLAGLVRDIEKIQSKLNRKVTPISEKDSKQAKVFVDSIDKAVEKYSKLGQVKNSQKINPVTKEIEAFKLAVTQADGKVKELQYDLAQLKGIQGAGKYALTGESVKDNIASVREKQLQQEQQINRQIEQQNQKLKHQLEMYKQEASLKAKNLINTNQNNKNFDDNVVKNWLNSVNALNTSTPMATQQMDRLRMQFRNIQSEAANSNTQVSRFGTTMENAFGRMPIYMAASAALFAPFVALDRLIDTLYLLDERLVTIDKVSENADLASIFDKATEAALKFGQTIDGTLESLGEIQKLGFSTADAESLNSNAMLLSTVGEFKSNADAANYLVAIMRQYKLEIADTARVVDALNEVSNKTGADTVSLSQGLSKASSTAATAGVSFHELNGMIANTQEVLKISGNEAGTFYKTLFSRFLRDKTQSMLQSLGIETKTMSGELRSATDVLRDLGDQWETFDAQTKNAIASQLGGGWHVAKTISLLENQDNVLKNINISMDSYGSATEELSTFQEGLRFKTNNMIASFQELAMTIGENGARDGIVKILESVTALTQGFTQVTEATNGYNIKLPILIGLAYGAVKAFGALKVALTGVKSAMGIFGLGLIAVETIASMFAKSASAADLNTEAMTELAQKTSDQKDELQKLVQTYNDLEPQAKNNTEKQKELEGVLSDIKTLAPHLIESTGKYGDALTLNKDKADEYIESLKAMSKEQFTMAQSANSIEMSTINVDLDKEQDKLNKLENSVKDAFNRMQDYQKKYNVQGLTDAEEEYNKRKIELANKASKAIEDGNKELSNKITLQLTEMLNEYAEYVKIIEDKGGKLSDYNDQIAKVQELEGRKGEIEARKKALDELINSTEGSNSANKRNADSLSTLKDGAYEAAEGVEGLSEAEKAAAGQAEKFDSALENIKNLNSIINDLNENHSVSADNLSLLIENYDNLLPYINDEATLRKKVQEEISKEEKIAKQAMLAKLQYNEHFYKQALKGNTELVKQFHKLYGVDLNSFKNLAAAKWKIEERVLEKISKAWSNHYTQAMHAASAIQMATGNHFSGSLLAMLNQSKIASSFAGMQMSFNDIFMDQIDLATGASIANNGLADSTEKAGKALESSTYISDKYKQALESVNLQLEKQRAIKAKFPQHSKEYQNALKNEIKLLDQQKKLIQEQAKSLDSQIKSGKIMEVGRVVTSKSSSSTSVSSGGTSSQIWNFFKSKGFTDSVVAGIMGNLQLESGLNPNALNKSSGAFGIAQWLGGRKTGLSNYAASMGTSMSDLNTQLNFLWKELKSTEKRTLNYLNSNQGASEASIAAAFDRLFERSEGTHIPQRQQFANQFLSQFRGTSGGTYSEASKEVPENMASVDSAKSQLLQLQQDAIAVEQQMQELFMDLVDAQLSSFDRIKNSYSDDLAKIDLIQRRETQGSKEWLIQQAEKEDIIDKQIEQEKKAVKFLKEQIKANKDLNAAQRSLLEDQLVDRYQELYSLEQNLLDEGISMAEQTIDTYKKAAEAQKNAAIKAIDEIINGINKEAEEADYKKKLENAQKSRQEILDEIAKLSIDDSFAAKKRIEELRKQFQEQEESIENMQDEKSRQDRIDSLNEQKENIESDYDNLINDERKFAQMRSDIINGNTKQIQKDLVKYYANIKANANVLGKALSNNLIDLINQANKYLNGKDYKPIKVAQAKNGGILPSWGSQGKAMIVHEEEMISNKHDTKNLLAAMGMSEKLVNALSNFKVPSILPNVAMPKLQSPPNVSNKTVGDTYFNVHIDNINGDSSLKYTMEKVAEAALKKSYENMVSGVKIIGGKM